MEQFVYRTNLYEILVCGGLNYYANEIYPEHLIKMETTSDF